MPTSDSNVVGYGTVLTIALIGGLVNYVRNMTTFRWITLAAHLGIAGFSGITAFWLADAVGIQWPALAAITGIAGHMGGRFIDKLEDILPALLRSK